MSRKPFFRAFDGWWYAQIRQGGRRKQVKLAKGKDKEAEAYRAFCRLMADEEGQLPAASARTVAVVCDFFLDNAKPRCEATTFAHYQGYLQNFCDKFGRIHVGELRPFHITKWLDAHPGWKASRRHAAICVKRAFRWCHGQGLIDKDPLVAFRPEKGNIRTRVLSHDERHQILAAIKDQAFRDFVFAMQETGCRPGEVATVTATDVNLDLGIWLMPKHKTAKKTGKPRIVYLTPAMIQLSKRLMARYPEGPLFRSPRGEKPFTRNNIRCRFRRLRAKLPHIPHFVCYNYRHTYATNALENGVDVAKVAELLGHSSTDMVMKHYQHLSQRVSHMREQAARATASQPECA